MIMENEPVKPRLRLVERPCPKCDHLMIANQKEDCIECTNCGYIDCGDED